MSNYALRFISGKYQGGEFPLRPDREVVIGRASDLDMVLVEDMVSRKHATIYTLEGKISIEDHGSTNGTFVNGEKVKKVLLKEGDRILIGTSIIKLVATDTPLDNMSDADARQRLEAAASRRRTSALSRPMSGSIDEIPLPDMLQLLSTSRKSGVVSIHGSSGMGKIYLRKGQVYYCTLDDAFDVKPRKAFFRMVAWTSGVFELGPPDDKAVLEEITESTEALLMEGMRQLDELHRLEGELPPRTAVLAVPTPLLLPLRALAANELDVLQLAMNHPGATLQSVLDGSPHTDLDTLTALQSLLKKEYLQLPRK